MTDPDKRNGIASVRDAINSALTNGRCVAVRLRYCDRNGSVWGNRDHQLLEFDVIRGPSGLETITSQPIAAGVTDLAALARQIALEH